MITFLELYDELNEKPKGLYYNINKKRKEGRKMRKKGEKGAPKASDFERASQTAKEGYQKFNQFILRNHWGEVTEKAEYQGRPVELNNPTRGDKKKFKVYVRNDKGNVVKVEYGDPNMEINEMTQQEERVFVQDTTAIIQAQSIRQDIGLVSSGVQKNL